MRIYRIRRLPGLAAACLAFVSVLGAADAQYVGQAKCKACHLNEHKAWAASAHARAIEASRTKRISIAALPR